MNDIVDRTVSLIGKPPSEVTAQGPHRTGLAHAGLRQVADDGVSAYMLRRHPALKNPTVMIVVDRRDLKTQISDDFDACDHPNVEKAMGVA